jgi:hypothetical protein
MPISSSLIAQEIHVTSLGLAVYVLSSRVARDSLTAGADEGSYRTSLNLSRPTSHFGHMSSADAQSSLL